MPDLATRYARLAADVDGTGLLSPHDLRRYADRRARRRSAVLAGAGVVVAAGSTSAGLALVGGSDSPLPGPTPTPPPSTAPATPPPSPSPPSPSPTPSAPPTSSVAVPPVTEIPTPAFFALPAENRRDAQRQDEEESLALPGFCDDAFDEDDTATARRSVRSVYQEPGQGADQGYVPYATIHQTITGYRDGGAEAFMDRFRAAAADCDTYDQDGTEVTYRVVDPPDAGDEAVYLVRTWPRLGPDRPDGFDTHIVVIRVGDVVTVLVDQGWEGTDSDPAYVARFVEWSVSAIEAWR